MRERRLCYYSLPEQATWDLVRTRWLLSDVIVLHWISGAPEDAEVVDVRHCLERRCFLFLLSHPSFGEVPDGMHLPYGGTLMVEQVRVELGPSGEVPAFRVLRWENVRMRRVLSDQLQDEERLRAAYELGRAEGYDAGLEASWHKE